MITLINIFLSLAILGAGALAGLYFIFSNTVIDALDRLPGLQGPLAMREINRVILNPRFFALFFGPALSGIAYGVMTILSEDISLSLVAILAILLVVSSVLTTMVGNIPLNNALEQAEENDAGMGEVWAVYRKKWLYWNHIRAVACALSCLLLTVSAI